MRTSNPLFSFALLRRSLDLWIQPHEVVIDGILLPRLRSLCHTIPAQISMAPIHPLSYTPPFRMSRRKEGQSRRTGASIQALNDCSNCWHPAAALPEDAQHPIHRLVSTGLTSLAGVQADVYIPKTEVMIPTQGFSPGLFGRRTRSLGRGGRRGGASFVLPPLGGMVAILALRKYGCYR